VFSSGSYCIKVTGKLVKLHKLENMTDQNSSVNVVASKLFTIFFNGLLFIENDTSNQRSGLFKILCSLEITDVKVYNFNV
jgi:hypothetical protein